MPTQTDALANVYAKSLFELAHQAGGQTKVSEVVQELEQIVELLRENEAFAEFMSSPIIDRSARGESLRKIFGNRITDLTLRFLLVLNDNRRLDRLEMVAAAFDHMVQDAYGRVEVDVYTAAPLERSQLEQVRHRVQEVLKREPVLHPYTEPSMIGGVKLRIGDQLIDGSIAGKLRRMKRELLSSGGTNLRDRLDRYFKDGGAS